MKDTYDMIDGIPIWQHLQNGAKKSGIKMNGSDFGKFAEILGKRILNKLTKKCGILDEIFPEIEIVNVHMARRKRIFNRAKIEVGDLMLEIDYKKGLGLGSESVSEFGKKIVIFEIKHGRFQIEQNQIRRYCFMIKKPGDYFPKADELKVIFLMFNEIDTLNARASYLIKEFDKDLVDKIINNIPINELEWEGIGGNMDNDIENKIQYGISALF